MIPPNVLEIVIREYNYLLEGQTSKIDFSIKKLNFVYN